MSFALAISSLFAFLTIVSVAALRFAERYGDPDVRAELDELRRQMHNQTKQQTAAKERFSDLGRYVLGLRVRVERLETEKDNPGPSREQRRRDRAKRILELNQRLAKARGLSWTDYGPELSELASLELENGRDRAPPLPCTHGDMNCPTCDWHNGLPAESLYA